jgi:Mlc titration factor MtfA (ptsG expression regulator)
MPAEWRPFLDRLPWARALSEEERARVEAGAVRFCDGKRWEGVEGLVVTDEMRATVSAHAAALALNLPDDAWWKVRTVLLYPAAFVTRHERTDPLGVSHVGMVQSGEAWDADGPVIVSWEDARRAFEREPAAEVARPARSASRGAPGSRVRAFAREEPASNVLFHELAHKLDMLDGWADGFPRFARRADAKAWRRVLDRERPALADDAARGHPTVLDPYGATNDGEFFAVATEAFFERPRALRERHRPLYETLARYYRQDPAVRPRYE